MLKRPTHLPTFPVYLHIALSPILTYIIYSLSLSLSLLSPFPFLTPFPPNTFPLFSPILT